MNFKRECNPNHLNNLTEQIKKLETQLQDQNKNNEVDRINKLETQLQNKTDEIEDLRNRSVRNHSCSNHLNSEMEAECLTKTLSYLNLSISRTKNGRNKV